MEEVKAKVMLVKSGNGSENYRLRIPTPWIRELGLDQDFEVTMNFDGDTISISKIQKEEKEMRACLVNKEGLVFDKTEGINLKAIKEWAKDRGCDEYTLIIYEEGKEEISYRVRNNRFYK